MNRIPEWLRLLCVLMAAVVFANRSSAAVFQDTFAYRETVVGYSGQIEGSNAGATKEVGEPKHADRTGGRSVWISWTAPTNGLVTFSTIGSSFDTLLGVYYLKSGTNQPLLRLQDIAEGEDDGPLLTSSAQCGVRAGQTYEIAVDGYRGATGTISLTWNLITSDQLPPIILGKSSDQSTTNGSTLELAVNFQPTDSVELEWLFNNEDMEVHTTNLVISGFSPANVGQYRLSFKANSVRLLSNPIEIQINSEGQITTLARNKPEDAVTAPLIGQTAARSGSSGGRATMDGPVGVARGYNGTQIFSTTYASRDPNEPIPCGVAGGASYWFAYQPPTNGLARINTDGSSYDTVVAVYTYNGTLTGYSDLIPVACDNNGGTNARSSKVQFVAEAGRTYLVDVDGVNGARGLARLNYELLTLGSSQLQPPAIIVHPQSHTTLVGRKATLSSVAQSPLPVRFQWYRNTVPMPKETNLTITLNSSQFSDIGFYSMTASNADGVAASNPALLAVTPIPTLTVSVQSNLLRVPLPDLGPLAYIVEFSDALGTNRWQAWTNPLANGFLVLTNNPSAPSLYFRLRIP